MKKECLFIYIAFIMMVLSTILNLISYFEKEECERLKPVNGNKLFANVNNGTSLAKLNGNNINQ